MWSFIFSHDCSHGLCLWIKSTLRNLVTTASVFCTFETWSFQVRLNTNMNSGAETETDEHNLRWWTHITGLNILTQIKNSSSVCLLCLWCRLWLTCGLLSFNSFHSLLLSSVPVLLLCVDDSSLHRLVSELSPSWRRQVNMTSVLQRRMSWASEEEISLRFLTSYTDTHNLCKI